MYTLRGFLTSILGMSPDEIPSEEIYCSESNTQLTFLTNTMQETLAAYSYALVREGWLELIYNGNELTLQRGDFINHFQSCSRFWCRRKAGTQRHWPPSKPIGRVDRTILHFIAFS